MQWKTVILRGNCEERRAQKEGKRKDERGKKERRGRGTGGEEEGTAIKV